MRPVLLIIVSALLILACSDEGPVESTQTAIAFTIVSEDSVGLAGVYVEARWDGETFRTISGATGGVQIPSAFVSGIVGLAKTNFMPMRVREFPIDTVVLSSTLMTPREIGPVEGSPVRFGEAQLVTFDFRGIYRLYTFTDQTVVKTLETRFSDTTIAIHKFSAVGDTLWFTTLGEGLIYALSMVDPAQPSVLFTFPYVETPGPIASRDSLIILGQDTQPGAVRILSYRDSSATELASIQQFFPEQIILIGTAAVFFGGNPLFAVFDLSDPTLPVLAYQYLLEGSHSTFMAGNLIFAPPVEQGMTSGFPLNYPAFNLANPTSPVQAFGFSSQAWVTSFVSPTAAVGVSYYHSGTRTFLTGGVPGFMNVMAAISGGVAVSVDGGRHPFYVFGGALWKLEE